MAEGEGDEGEVEEVEEVDFSAGEDQVVVVTGQDQHPHQGPSVP